jgi:glutaredoxin 2
MSHKFSIVEYTPEEKAANGNGMYGGKRHDEICDYLQGSFKWDETKINEVSIGIWLAIDAEKKAQEAKIKELEATVEHVTRKFNDSVEAYIKRFDKCIEAEKKLAEAVEALEEISEDTIEFFEKPRPSLMADIATKALEKLKAK